ncbi:hypothetical protein Sros01_72180 [Streptomyces roseochromogenus]|nr:hypothetical protein Sros01_72180 [Streptomyces roseochromogenus]
MHEIVNEILRSLAGELPASLITAAVTAGASFLVQQLRRKAKKEDTK